MNMKQRTWYALNLGFIGFVTSFGAHIVAVNLPFYAETVGIGMAAIGLLIAAYDFAEIIAKPVFGALADRQGLKRTMLVGIAIFTLASLAYPLIDPRLLLFVRFLQGLGAAALSAVSLALVGVYYPQNRGQAFGIYNAIKGAGYVVSPIVGGAIVLSSNFASIFIAAAAIGLLAFLVSLPLPNVREVLREALDDDDDDFSLVSLVAVFRAPILRPWYMVTIVNMFFVGIIFGFFPVRIHALGYDPLTAGVLLTFVSGSYLLIQPIAGTLADRVNPSDTIRVGLLLAALSILLFPFAEGIPLVILAIIAGVGVGTVWTNTDTLVSRLAQAGRLGATLGAAGSFKEFGDLMGPLLIGVVSQALGLEVGFVICGVLGLVSVLLMSRTKLASEGAMEG
jgi:DHA1 family tetracycline resistance protein-like MFS transporter